jgi:hypothetical protein
VGAHIKGTEFLASTILAYLFLENIIEAGKEQYIGQVAYFFSFYG